MLAAATTNGPTTSTTAIGGVILGLILVGFVAFVLINILRARSDVGAEVYLAPNRKPYYDDETLEGPRLTRLLGIATVLMLLLVVGLPLYWILEPGNHEAAAKAKEEQFVEWGAALFAPTADGGFNCSGCHGGANATGGVAAYNITDPNTGAVRVVQWKAPALNTVTYRFSDDEIRYILVYGRPFSPMSAWGTEGGGPMNEQKIDTLIAYIHSIQIPREGCIEAEQGDPQCPTGHLPTELQDEIDAAADAAVKDGTAKTRGEALFNNAMASGAYGCARCHTNGWSYDEPGKPGQGAMGWNLTGGSVNSHFPNEQDMIDFIKNGSERGKKYGVQGQGNGNMPGFGSTLTDEQINEIVEYVRSL